MEHLLRAIQVLLDLDNLIKTRRVLHLDNCRRQRRPPTERLIPRFAFPASQLWIRSKGIQEFRKLAKATRAGYLRVCNTRAMLGAVNYFAQADKKLRLGNIENNNNALFVGGECAGESVRTHVRMDLSIEHKENE